MEEIQTKTLLGRYEILSSLGVGGMAEVFLAEDTHTNQKVAIKFPNFGSDEKLSRIRFMREAKAISRLNHPNIAKLYHISEDEDNPFLVIEYIDGETLTDRLYKGSLTLGRAVEVVIQIAEALEAAHKAGFIHRDLKPSNVMIAKDGSVKVLDFGLAKQIKRDDSGELTMTTDYFTGTQARTMSGVIVGTPMYLSPEQATAEDVDQRSDVFSLGALLYECLTGRPAFTGNTFAEISAKVLRDDPTPPSVINTNVPNELDRIALKALAKRREDRFQSAKEFVKALRKVNLSKVEHTALPVFLSKTLDYKRLITKTLTDVANKPRFSLGSIALASIIIFASVFAFYLLFWRVKEYQPRLEVKQKYDEGVALIQEGALYSAVQKLEEAIALDPDFALAHARLAEAWFELDYEDRTLRETIKYKDLISSGIHLSKTDRLYGDAISASVQHEYAKAVRDYEELVSLSSSDPTLLSDLARAYDRNSEFEKALTQYYKAIDSNPKYANAYLRIGELYSRRKDSASANKVFDEAEKLYTEQKNDEGLAEVFLERGRFYNHLDMSQEATGYLQKASELSIAKNLMHPRIEVLIQLTSVAYTIGEFDKANQYAQEAIDLARKNEFDVLEISGYIELANTYTYSGKKTEALQYYEQAIKQANRLKSNYRKAVALSGVANVYVSNGQLEQAEKALNDALMIYEKQSYRKESLTANLSFAQLKDVQGKFKESLDIINNVYMKVEAIGDSALIAAYRYQLAITNQHLEHYQIALQHAKESQRLLEKLEASADLVYTLVTIGEIYTQTGDLENAQKNFNDALSLAEKHEEKDLYALALINVGKARLELSKMQFRNAIELSNKALKYEKEDVSDARISALFTLAEAQALAGEKQKSLATGQKVVEMARQLKYPYYLNQALYSLALSQYVNGKYGDALKSATEGHNGLKTLNKDFEGYKMLAIAANSSDKLGDKSGAKTYAEQANASLTSLKTKFLESDFNHFLNRPDIQSERKQLENILQLSK